MSDVSDSRLEELALSYDDLCDPRGDYLDEVASALRELQRLRVQLKDAVVIQGGDVFNKASAAPDLREVVEDVRVCAAMTVATNEREDNCCSRELTKMGRGILALLPERAEGVPDECD